MSEKRFSELTQEEKDEYEWVCTEWPPSKDPLVIRGMKKVALSEPPEGYEWQEVTELGDDQQRFILVKENPFKKIDPKE